MTFTPIETFIGGVLLHLSTSTLLSDTGRVLGISGIVDGAVLSPTEKWRWAVVLGLLSGPFITSITGLRIICPGDALQTLASVSHTRMLVAGALVGFGTRLGSGCTSGHMLCGVSRLSPRSIIATAVFFTAAVITANVSTPPFTYAPTHTHPDATLSTAAVLLALVGTVMMTIAALRRYLDAHVATAQPWRLAPYYLSGLIFSLGLQISGMTDARKVWGFLRVLHPYSVEFDPSLGMIILGGLVPNGLHYYALVNNKTGPSPVARYPWEAWKVSTAQNIDRRLLSGALLFGTGWGMVGVCPGPIIVALGDSIMHNNAIDHEDSLGKVVEFTLAMVSGMAVARVV